MPVVIDVICEHVVYVVLYSSIVSCTPLAITSVATICTCMLLGQSSSWAFTQSPPSQ
jgi:hypothetical protein